MHRVGRAGGLLTQLIEGIGLTRADVYIANVVKCRPPGNRDPQPEEIAALEAFARNGKGLILVNHCGELNEWGDKREKLPPEVIKAIFQKDASIVSPDPVPVKTWTHVSVRNQSHPMPGGGEPFDAVL